MKVILLAIIFLISGCTNLFFYPDKRRYTSPRDYGINFQEFELKEVEKPTLIGWELEPHGQEKGVILFLHGNAGNISTNLGSVIWLQEAGYRVFLIDYAGYGGSQGDVELSQVHDDVRRMFRYVISREPRPERRILFGQSLGGSVGLRVSNEDEFSNTFKLVISDSAFSSYRKVAREKIGYYWLTIPLQWPLGFLVRDDLSPISTLNAAQGAPILFVHGKNDSTVLAEDCDILCNKAGERCTKIVVEGYDHTRYLQTRQGRDQVLSWIAEKSLWVSR